MHGRQTVIIEKPTLVTCIWELSYLWKSSNTWTLCRWGRRHVFFSGYFIWKNLVKEYVARHICPQVATNLLLYSMFQMTITHLCIQIIWFLQRMYYYILYACTWNKKFQSFDLLKSITGTPQQSNMFIFRNNTEDNWFSS